MWFALNVCAFNFHSGLWSGGKASGTWIYDPGAGINSYLKGIG